MKISKPKSFAEWYDRCPGKQADLPKLKDCSLRGTISASYDQLVALFGEPEPSKEPEKVQVEWLVFLDEIPVSVYDWKSQVPPERVKRMSRSWVDIFEQLTWHLQPLRQGTVFLEHFKPTRIILEVA